ncbi:MAG: radical SAM family heme chaperone HemW, partial [Alphaproteobacteria bacterium]|nr:radical SAM family heme chaperone HemW [Alphaproteobacteria bacterium]
MTSPVSSVPLTPPSAPSFAGDVLSVYVHWPFCTTICPYCDFNVYGARTIDEDIWAQAFIADLSYAAEFGEKKPVQSVFFGGGTPSLMSPHLLAMCLTQIDKLWGLSPCAEISLEANPAHNPQSLYKDLYAAGITRLSLGVQSLDDKVLTFLGRTHNAAQACAAFAAAQKIFPASSLDIIYAYPEQSRQDWQAQLKNVLALEPAHISAYQLTIEQGTRFYKDHAQGRFTMPDETQAALLYETTQEQCAAAGLAAYEISNHARDIGSQCQHNVLIWQGGDYVGVGAGSHGRLTQKETGKRFATYGTPRPQDWLAHIKTHGHGLCEMTSLDEGAQREETLLLGLRLVEGLSFAQLKKQRVVLSPDKIKSLAAQGLLELSDTHIAVSAAGRLVLDSVIAA